MPRRSIACRFLLWCVAAWLAGLPLALAAEPTLPREVDARRAAAAGIRRLDGRHVRLYTDLPSSAAIDELPVVFDAAVDQWADYFGLSASSIRGQWQGFLIGDRQRFAALDLLPVENPEFVNGYARDYEFWLVEQPSDYYRRHLLLHEGTHAFMQTQLGGAGPGWYMEGMAELLGTHRWRQDKLTLGVMPASKAETPMWGRVKIIRDAVAAGKPWPLEAVLAVDNRRALSTEHYAWTWALAAMLDGTPSLRDRFRSLQRHVADPNFNDRFRETMQDHWGPLQLEWAGFVSQLDYGYDLDRMAVVLQPPRRPGDSSSVEIAVDRGWQSTGWRLQAGRKYRVTASGRFQIAHDGRPWPCEPGGVTIDYQDGRPLGALLGALQPIDGQPLIEGDAASFFSPALIGVETTLQPVRDSILYLRVNDSPAKLGDNVGSLEVRWEPLSPHEAPARD